MSPCFSELESKFCLTFIRKKVWVKHDFDSLVIIESLRKKLRHSIYLSVRFLLGNGALPRESLVLWPLTEKGIIHVCSHVVKRKIL